MDRPNINWKFLELLTESRVEAEIPSLINIGSCGIHVMHGAFKTGTKASGWAVSKILKALARLFLDSPVRGADFVEMTGSSLFPMSFCAARWIKDEPFAQHAIQIWDHVGKIVKYWSKLPKSKQPSTYCFSTIKDAVDDNRQWQNFISLFLLRLSCVHFWNHTKQTLQWFHFFILTSRS